MTLLDDLRQRVGSDTVTDAEYRRRAVAHDASHFLLVPSVVATPRSTDDVARLLGACHELALPVTFRSGGSSLSGQASTEHLLADTRQAFRQVEVLDDGRQVRVGPGMTIGQVNARLARYGRRLGPDPASETACTIGGLVANNSSGMTCGTTFNTYRTLRSVVLVLPSGTVVDTADSDADDRLRAREPALHAELLRLRDRVRGEPASMARIEKLYSIKNTMGYGVNAFADFDVPIDILMHLVIGSEGTVAFVASAVFDTLPVHPEAATGLLVFDSLAAATGVLDELASTEPQVIELLDRTSLAVCQRDPRGGSLLADIDVRRHAALLVEYQEDEPEVLASRLSTAEDLVGSFGLERATSFTQDAGERADLWHLRKGLYATVAGHRPPGTSALLEDVAVPRSSLLPLCEELLGMFDQHAYVDPVIFGHAKDGNIHFLLNERFDDQPSMRRFEQFTDQMVDLVLGLDGTLKAEHGTGRVMAPFVERQYGSELYDVMRAVKRAVDPHGILNPGVLLSDDEAVHVKHLKSAPPVEEEVDGCVECGYCEPVCPSRDLTMTPRQRIVLRREVAAARASGDHALADRLESEATYEAVDTCAADGMCSVACPLGIDTGALVKRQRRYSAGRLEQLAWGRAARHWSAVSRAGGAALSAARGAPGVAGRASRMVRRVTDDAVPAYTEDLPAGGRARADQSHPDADVVVFASCLGTMFGSDAGVGSGEALRRLLDRAGLGWRTPVGSASLCCTMPWTSKGLTDGAATMSARTARALGEATDEGRLPVVCDAASCTEGLEHVRRTALREGRELQVVDALSYVAGTVLPRLHERGLVAEPVWESAVLHPTCSTRKAGLDADLAAVAAAVARHVETPVAWGCCGFAGDRGLLHPELTASATAQEAAEVRAGEHDLHLSANRTCELGMTRATGRTYAHALEALEAATRPGRAT